MKSITIIQLEYVAAVARTKNFVKAAKECFISQPTLSMQIRKLEDDLGAILFDRSKKPVEPTSIGRKIIDQAQLALQETARIEEIIKEEEGEISGPFKLGIIPTLSPYLLPLFLEGFIKAYPKVNLIVEELQTQQIIGKLKQDEIDAGILVTPLKVDGILEKPVFKDPFLVYISPNHPLKKKKKVSGEDLLLEDIWLLNEGHCFRDQAIEICSRVKGKGLPRKNLEFESGNLETLKRLADRNFGYTLVPSIATQEMTATQKNKKLRHFKAPIPTREVSIVHSRSYLKKSIIEALHENIRSSLPVEYLDETAKEKVIKLPKFI